MAMIHSTSGLAGHGSERGLVARVAQVIEGIREARARRRLFNTTRRELSALSTHELNDLGISRAMITRIAQEAAYGR